MLKLGLFGAGHLGKLHLDHWQKLEDIQVVGFYEPYDIDAREISKTYNLKRFNTPEQLIQASDAVDIIAATPHHHELTKKCILKSRHVMVEKPMARSMDEAREIVQLAREANINLLVGHEERFNPAFCKILNEDLNPSYIESQRLTEYNSHDKGMSVVLDLMTHDIDIILSVVKGEVKNIYANGVNVMSKSTDIANARIEFDNGCVANLTASRVSMKKMEKMNLFQPSRAVTVDFLEGKTNSNGAATRAQLESFRDSILNKSHTLISEVDGLRSMEVAHTIMEKIGRNPIR